MAVGQRKTGLLAVFVACEDCGWACESRNGAGLAAQHAHRTGHTVRVEQTTIVIYNPKA